MPLITLFTAPKPFTDPHIDMIQRNAINSWKALGSEVEILLLGEEDGLEEAARDQGMKWIPQLERNPDGTPLISSMFDQAKKHASGQILGIINTDIILLPAFFVEAVRKVMARSPKFLLLGHRWDLELTNPLSFHEGWQDDLMDRVKQAGSLHKSKGSDYFIFPVDAFPQFPRFAIGRAGWDNWTIFYARKQRWPVIDCTAAITVIHQQHDYHHLPGGKIHYAPPESDENLRLAGGKRHIFTLADANYQLDQQAFIHRMPDSWERLKRELEIFPILRWDKPGLNDLAFYLFHPRKFIRHKFPRLAKVLGIKGKADDLESAG